ncbi:putative FAD dependent oxidoreductase, FAD/NAD(P)-binding domain superfamily, MTOX family [Septoria linicola]|nr:putative FAD dependent oxidoreductase, FAD/NAD(P)-binding domain superfamily, MTOX family [Septoria linicola]
MASANSSYLIVGAGVFGISTAYHLIKKYPNASITVVDRDAYDADSRVAASWDWNKVVRADYDDILYCRLALEAQDIFRSEELWKPFFHETGIWWACRSDYAQDVLDNYKKLGRNADLKAISISEAKQLFGGVFNEADYDGVKEVLLNKTSGWAAAGDCLRAVTKKAIELGVKYVVADVQTLEFGSRGECTGVRTAAGQSLSATHTILSTGAFTSKLLEWSAHSSGNKELRAGDRILAAGITTGMTTLNDQDYSSFKDMPVGVQGYTAATGPFIGSLPPTKDRELKWWGQTIFSNNTEVFPGRFISAPPAKSDYAQWDTSKRMKQDIDYANHVFYGRKGKDWKFDKHRVCWDAFTTSADFIISPHAGAKGLYVATCGNFHGWKFFPVLGKYIVQMLEGELEDELKNKWAWDRARPDPSENPDWPRAEYKALLDPVRTAKL